MLLFLFNQLVDQRKLLLINLSNMGVIACDCDVRDGNGDGDSDSMVRYNESNFLAHEPLHLVNLNEKVYFWAASDNNHTLDIKHLVIIM